MPRLRRAVGHASPHARPLLDQRYPEVIGSVTQQMAGEQYAACAPADDDHMPLGICRHASISHSPNSADVAHQSTDTPRWMIRNSASMSASTSSVVL